MFAVDSLALEGVGIDWRKRLDDEYESVLIDHTDEIDTNQCQLLYHRHLRLRLRHPRLVCFHHLHQTVQLLPSSSNTNTSMPTDVKGILHTLKSYLVSSSRKVAIAFLSLVSQQLFAKRNGSDCQPKGQYIFVSIAVCIWRVCYVCRSIRWWIVRSVHDCRGHGLLRTSSKSLVLLRSLACCIIDVCIGIGSIIIWPIVFSFSFIRHNCYCYC